MARAFYRSYVHDQRRASRVTRLHIVREDGAFPGRAGECGTHAWAVTQSEPIVIDPMPAAPPQGLRWCPLCIAKLAERAGRIDAWAADLARSGDGA